MKTGTLLARLTVLAAIVGLLPLGARLWWGFDLVSHFRVQYLAVTLPLLVAVLACRRRTAALLLCATAGLNAWPLLPYLPASSATAASPGGSELKVLNINVNAGNRDYPAILDAIRGADADIVAVLELTPGLDDALRAVAAMYPYTYSLPATSNFGIGVLSRYPLAAQTLPLLATKAIDGRVELPTGTLRFIAVHLVPPIHSDFAQMRNRQLGELAAVVRASGGPLAVCGDFNLTPYSPFFGGFREQSGLTEARRGKGIAMSWPRFMPLLGIPIDHCFIREPLGARSVEHLERTGSDHYPILVTLTWPGSE